jgi:FkbM family methyltransferase
MPDIGQPDAPVPSVGQERHSGSLDLITEKRRLEGLMCERPHDIPLREAYFGCLLQISRAYLGAIFVILPEIRAPLMFRAASSDIFNLTNVFSYAENIADYSYGLYGFEISSPRRILDIGAYCGYSAIYFAHRFPDAEIVCIEPPGSNFDTLVANTAVYPAIRCIPAAVWPVRAQVVAAGHHSGDWGNLYSAVNDGAPQPTIPGYTIDEVLEMVGWDKADFIKCQAENVVVDVLCIGERKWLKEVSCFCAMKPGGMWPRAGDEQRLEAEFPDALFSTTRHENGLYVFTRRGAETPLPRPDPALFRLIPPSPQSRPFVLANVPDDPSRFYKFDYGSLHLVPNPPGAPPASLKLPVSLDGQRRFCTTIVTGPTESVVRFRVTLVAKASGEAILDVSNELPQESRYEWKIGFAPAHGMHEVTISVETMRGGNPSPWTQLIDPRLE